MSNIEQRPISILLDQRVLDPIGTEEIGVELILKALNSTIEMYFYAADVYWVE